MTTIDEWFTKPVILAHPKWFEVPAKWAQRETTLDKAEQVILLRYTTIFCQQNNIAEMGDSEVGAQYPLETVRHVHDILFGRHRRPGRPKQEKRIELREGGRARLPVFCTYPPPLAPHNPSKYPPLNKEILLAQRKKLEHAQMWLKTYSRLPITKWADVIHETWNYCDRFNVKYKDHRVPPMVLKHVHDTMNSKDMRRNRKPQGKHVEYVYPGYNYK